VKGPDKGGGTEQTKKKEGIKDNKKQPRDPTKAATWAKTKDKEGKKKKVVRTNQNDRADRRTGNRLEARGRKKGKLSKKNQATKGAQPKKCRKDIRHSATHCVGGGGHSLTTAYRLWKKTGHRKDLKKRNRH